MGTYVENHDGCTNGVVPPISRFKPEQLNTNNWVQTMLDIGAKYAVLVAKVVQSLFHIDECNLILRGLLF